MKLDVNVLRYLSKDDFRVLVAVELGMRNHEIVPSALIDRIARLKHGGTYKVLKNLLKHKLLHHDSSDYDGFRLTYLGYDFLAISALVKSGVITAVGRQIGVGKESDIFEVVNEEGTVMAMKLHRLGRVSFRAVKNKRDYLRHRSSFSWLYLSRLAALKEFAFMKALEDHGFPVPKAVDCNRHCVIMSLVKGYPLVQVKHVENPDVVFETVIGLIVRLAEHGLIHCDFNEFNIMIDDDENVTMIDFPQMVSVNHRNAKMYFDRDVECIFKFFRKRFKLTFELQSDEVNDQVTDDDSRLNLSSIVKDAISLDKELAASGYVKEEQVDLDRFIEGNAGDRGSDDEELTDDELDAAGESTTSPNVDELNERDITEFDSLELTKQETEGQACNVVNSQEILSASSRSREDEKEADDEEEESDEERDPELIKSLSKQREKAIASARGGRRQSYTSRNSYKDKGGKSSRSSKVIKSGDW
ncbi:serine/threonine-protein kinase rio2 isoform X1 [Silene latifolia]|uniref:serine/threonine-protein kinase rio2 isoform X1 n=1 Tax=Silene latifolia TaxID=37657 RepID=UPI003D76A87F